MMDSSCGNFAVWAVRDVCRPPSNDDATIIASAAREEVVDPDGADNVAGTEDDNLRLSDTSPCANAGDNAAVISTTDADDMPRIMFDAVDMGAYELQEPPAVADVPTTAEWGLAIMTVLLATAGTLVLRRRVAI